MDKRIERIEHEGESGWWVILKPGYILKGEWTHAIVEERKRDAMGKMSQVVPCGCRECAATVERAVGA